MNANDTNDREGFEPPVLQGLAQAVPQVDPPAELRSRVLASAVTHAGSTIAPAPSRTPWMLATAASLVLAIGLAAYTTQLRQQISALEEDLRDTRADAEANRRQVADARATASSAQSAIGVLSAPDVKRVDLAGQPVSPSASGRAFWSRSHGLVFSAAQLPQLPAGRTYQLWVVTTEGPVNAGLLKPSAQGGAETFVVTPVEIAQPVAVAVTIEPEGGMPSPTGDKYLVGTL